MELKEKYTIDIYNILIDLFSWPKIKGEKKSVFFLIFVGIRDARDALFTFEISKSLMSSFTFSIGYIFKIN